MKVVLLKQLGDSYKKVDLDSTAFYYQKAVEIECDNCAPPKALTFIAYSQLEAYRNDSNAINLAQNGLQLFEELNDSLNIVIGLYEIALRYLAFQKQQEATSYFRKSIAKAIKHNLEIRQAKPLTNIGYIHARSGLYDSAAIYLRKSIDISIKEGEKPSQKALLNVGAVYFQSGNSKMALEYYHKALQRAVEEQDQTIEAICYQNMGAANTKLKNWTESKKYLSKAFIIYQMRNDSSSMATYYASIAEINHAQKKHDSTLINYQKARQIFPKTGPPNRKLFVHLNLARTYLTQGKGKNKSYVQKAIEEGLLAHKIIMAGQYTANEIEVSEILFKSYSDLKLYEKAAPFANTALLLKDSLYNKQRLAAIVEVQEKYETEKKELEIELLNKDNLLKENALTESIEINQSKNRIIILTIVGLALSLLIVLLLVARSRQKENTNAKLVAQNNTIQKQNNEKELLLKEIHHRVKNNLQVISSLLELQSKKVSDTESEVFKEGQSRVRAMALIHEELYQNENNLGEVDFKTYTAKLSRQIQSLFPGKESVSIMIDGPSLKLDIDTAIPLGLIINELVTNSFKYGLDEKGQLSIVFKEMEKGNYSVSVSDNGQGLAEDFDYKKSKSLGLRLVNRLTKQLYGKVEYSNNEKSIFEINFKNTIERKKVA
ncbi:MAG: tetratricopeptide repeat-containing sensor histidine kinase [Bacteroidia bacterium]